MLTGILIISVVTFIAVVSYRRPRLEQRVIKNIPLIDWFLIFVFPIFFYFGLVMIIKSVLLRERLNLLDFDDTQIIGIGTLFMIYSFVGISVHFVSKVLSRYIKRSKEPKVYQINELFHGKLSHYVTFACAYMVVFSLALLEINYPMPVRLTNLTIGAIISAGILAGFSAFKGIFYTNVWFGGYNKPFFLISLVFQLILSSIYRSQKLIMNYYPMNIFISVILLTVISIYVFRQFMIFFKLSKRRRLQFISRILSI